MDVKVHHGTEGSHEKVHTCFSGGISCGVILYPMVGKAQMGPGMMGPGYPGYGPYQYGPQYQQPQEPLKEKDVKAIVENYLQSTRNPNLKLGKIKEKDNYFEAEILTKDNSLVDKIIVDRFSGWIRSLY